MTACLCVALIAPTGVAAQEAGPGLPFGTVAVVLPVQSSLPSPGGAWPAGAASEEAAVRAMDAELAFALVERRGARDWALAQELRRGTARNPTLDVDPDRVAYQGLLKAPDRREQLYEPLHGQLRALAALHGTRFVVLPLVLRSAAVDPSGTDEAAGANESCKHGAPRERPELLLALIDIRRSAVLWHGAIRGPAGCPESGGLLAGLAAQVALQLTDS